MNKITVAISTYGERIFSLTDWYFDIRVSYLIIWQKSENFISPFFPSNVVVINLNSIGVAKSRNYAITVCQSDWLWFMDDDVQIDNGAYNNLFEVIDNYSGSDILITSVDFGQGSASKKLNGSSKSILSVTSIGTIQIICSPVLARNTKSYFPENMGAGTSYPVCDEPVFLFRMLKNAGIIFVGIPKICVKHAPVSSGLNLLESNHLISRAMFFREAFGFPSCIFISIFFYIKNFEKIKLNFPSLFIYKKPT